MVNNIDNQVGKEVQLVQIEPKKKNLYVNNALITLVVVLVISILFSYFTSFVLNASIKVSDLAINSVILSLETFIVGFCFRQIAINKALDTDDYKKAKENALNDIQTLRDSGFAPRVVEYCEWYSKNVYEETKKRIVESVGIKYEDYLTKYANRPKNDTEILKLTKNQKKAIAKADKLKIEKYNADYLLTMDDTNNDVMPSNRYNPQGSKTKNTIQTLFGTILTATFTCGVGIDLLMNFSWQTVLLAVLKLITMGITAVRKTVFGWNVIFNEEIPNYELKSSEIKNCIEYCKNTQKSLDNADIV